MSEPSSCESKRASYFFFLSFILVLPSLCIFPKYSYSVLYILVFGFPFTVIFCVLEHDANNIVINIAEHDMINLFIVCFFYLLIIVQYTSFYSIPHITNVVVGHQYPAWFIHGIGL